MRVTHDIIACYSEVYFSMLFSRFESDTYMLISQYTYILISQFTTFSSLRFDVDYDMHIMIKMISRYYLSNYHPNINKISKYQFSNK